MKKTGDLQLNLINSKTHGTVHTHTHTHTHTQVILKNQKFLNQNHKEKYFL